MSHPSPPHLWNRRPNEPAPDYLLFIAWLRLPPPRPLRPAPAALKCRYYRLRALCARHQWKTRARAYDNCRADAASHSLDRALLEQSVDLKRRAGLFREQEWALHEEMLATASEALEKIRLGKRCPSLPEIVRLCDLASLLGRRACGLPATAEPPSAPAADPAYDFEQALKKIYG